MSEGPGGPGLVPRRPRVFELHFFSGLAYGEIAAALDISGATVEPDLRFARAWLRKDLAPGACSGVDGGGHRRKHPISATFGPRRCLLFPFWGKLHASLPT
ncbi:MAG: ECF-type sigma factor [Acidobacteriota bacterium]